jgi:hypothetical protein
MVTSDAQGKCPDSSWSAAGKGNKCTMRTVVT